MSNISIVEAKISAIQKYLKILKIYQSTPQNKLENDITLKGAVERYLYLLSQAVIDLAESLIAFKDLRRPTTYSDSFHILHEEGLIDAGLTKKLVKMAGFRNIIAHDYEDLDFGITYDILQNHLQDIEDFILVIKKQFLLRAQEGFSLVLLVIAAGILLGGILYSYKTTPSKPVPGYKISVPCGLGINPCYSSPGLL